MQVEAWLRRAARMAPTLTALQTPDGRVSYAELARRAQVGAGVLAERDVAPGERVAIALPPGIAFAEALHACFLHRAVAVPVDLRLTAPERERIAAGVSLLVDEPLRTDSAEAILLRGATMRGATGRDETMHGVTTHDLDAV